MTPAKVEIMKSVVLIMLVDTKYRNIWLLIREFGSTVYSFVQCISSDKKYRHFKCRTLIGYNKVKFIFKNP